MTLAQFFQFLVGLLGYNPFAAVADQAVASGATVVQFLTTVRASTQGAMRDLVDQMLAWFS